MKITLLETGLYSRPAPLKLVPKNVPPHCHGTGVGPHRDDVHLAVNRRDLRLYGSHGQARTALATLKLAEVSYYAGAYDRPPILVMDEVASVLDRERAVNLVKLLSEEASQVFLTSPGEEELGWVAEEAGCIVLVDEGKAKIRR